MTFEEKEERVQRALADYPTFHEWFWNMLKSGRSYNSGVNEVTEEDIKTHKKLSKERAIEQKWGDDKGTVMNETPVELPTIKTGLKTLAQKTAKKE